MKSNIKREMKQCSHGCGFQKDWPAALARHEASCKGPAPVEDLITEPKSPPTSKYVKECGYYNAQVVKVHLPFTWRCSNRSSGVRGLRFYEKLLFRHCPVCGETTQYNVLPTSKVTRGLPKRSRTEIQEEAREKKQGQSLSPSAVSVLEHLKTLKGAASREQIMLQCKIPERTLNDVLLQLIAHEKIRIRYSLLDARTRLYEAIR